MNPGERLYTVLQQLRDTLQEQLKQIDTDLDAGEITEAQAKVKRLLEATDDRRIHDEILKQLHNHLT
jgi:glutaredoxin-related protein